MSPTGGRGGGAADRVGEVDIDLVGQAMLLALPTEKPLTLARLVRVLRLGFRVRVGSGLGLGLGLRLGLRLGLPPWPSRAL